MADAPGIPSLSIERLSISNGVANATKAPRGKEEKPSKEPKPPAKTSKPPGAVGSTATASKPDGEPRRRQVDATTLEDNQPGSRRSTEATAQSSSERSARRGEASSSTRVSRSQVRWAPPSLNSPASPPYSSQGNDYEWYLDGEMDEYFLPEGPYPWAAPFMPPYGGAMPPPYAGSALLPQPGAPSLANPYAVFTPYQLGQGSYWSPQMPFQPVPYPAPYAPVTPVPYYGYTGTFAPGYSDFFSVYPGYASYEPLHRASAAVEGREEPAQDGAATRTAPPDSKATGRSKASGRSEAGKSAKPKGKADGAKDSVGDDKRGPKQSEGSAPGRF
ncbi:hypothetical protein V5799_014646 [Amblyomma americanum]|uniref:Uncharacterized protein n=1 Tax=Amblyomma americanum TaxID=6943 RepID=A0AAQ4E2E9_AMBAM